MRRVSLQSQNDFDEWRGHARDLLLAGVRPEDITWQVGPSADLFGEEGDLPVAQAGAVGRVSRAFIALGESAIQHSDPQRFAILYRLLWRQQNDSTLLLNAADRDNSLLTLMASAVRRDSHKMKAFVRFRSFHDDGGQERFVAWFEPEHYTLEATAPFFARRFAGMHWGIVTPYASAWWDTQNLSFGPGGNKKDVPADDLVEEDWKTYYSSIFNPARLKVSMMKSEMPVKYWRNLPEAERIKPLIRQAKSLKEAMIERAASQPPAHHLRRKAREPEVEQYREINSLTAAREAVQNCRRCPLYEQATQAVFGEGPADADLLFVGEQPGDQEDLAGRPFVGPAGQVFDDAIKNAGIDRRRVYVTNAVKHFKFIPRGKRRIHQRPDGGEIQACKFWLNLELAMVKPKIVVALGASAAQSLLEKKDIKISALRGRPIELGDGVLLFVTNHPSYLLRIPDAEGRLRERARFEDDLALIRDAAEGLKKSVAGHGTS